MHAATPSNNTPESAAKLPRSKRQPSRTKGQTANKARGVRIFPDRQATVAEVAKWIKTGELPERCKC